MEASSMTPAVTAPENTASWRDLLAAARAVARLQAAEPEPGPEEHI